MQVPAILYDAIQREASTQNVDPLLIAAVCFQEGGLQEYPPDGDGGMSHGPMQLHRQGAGAGRSIKELRHVESNVRIGSAYLAEKLAQYSDLLLALTAYNWPSLAATGQISAYGRTVASHYARFQAEGIERDPAGGPDPTDLECIDAIYGSLGPAETLERDLLLMLKARLLP